MDDDATPSRRGQGCSVLYAIGRLSGQVDSLQAANKELPERITANLTPTLAAHGTMLNAHGVRLDKLERRQWLWLGGGMTLLTIVTLAATTTLHLPQP